MTPFTRDTLIYGLATLIGFAVYFVLHNLYSVDFSIAMLLGFVGTHGAVMAGRHFLK